MRVFAAAGFSRKTVRSIEVGEVLFVQPETLRRYLEATGHVDRLGDLEVVLDDLRRWYPEPRPPGLPQRRDEPRRSWPAPGPGDLLTWASLAALGGVIGNLSTEFLKSRAAAIRFWYRSRRARKRAMEPTRQLSEAQAHAMNLACAAVRRRFPALSGLEPVEVRHDTGTGCWQITVRANNNSSRYLVSLSLNDPNEVTIVTLPAQP